MVKKAFLGWEKSFIESVAKLCVGNSTALKVVLPSLEACAELNLEILKQEINSVEILTLKQFFAGLIKTKLKIANSTIRIFTWHKTLKQVEINFLESLFPGEFKYGNVNLFSLARLINQYCEIIFSADKDFMQVAEVCDREKIDNSEFWKGLNTLFEQYLKTLTANGYIDIDYSLINPNNLRTSAELVIIAGCHNLDKQAVKIIEALSKNTEIIIALNAPEKFTSGFDQYGVIQTDYWETLETQIKSENISFCESVADEIELTTDYCKENENLTIYPLEEAVLKILSARLHAKNLKFDNHLSQRLNSNDLIKLISTIIAFCNEDSAVNLARLIRDRYIRKFVAKTSNPSELIHQLNTIRSNYFPKNLALDCAILGSKLDNHAESLKQLGEIINKLKKETSLEKAITLLISNLAPEMDEEDSKSLSILLENAARIDESKLSSDTLLSISEIISSLSFRNLTNSASTKLKSFSDLTYSNLSEVIILGISDQTLPSNEHELIYKPLANKIGLTNYANANASIAMTFLSQRKSKFKLFNSKLSINGETLAPSRFLFQANSSQNPQRILDFTTANAVRKQQSFKSFEVKLPETKSSIINKISASSYRDYIECPYRFYLKHILKINSSNDKELEMNGAVFGKLAHLVLENFSNKTLATKIKLDSAFDLAFQETIDKYFPWTPYSVIYLQLEQLRERLKSIIDIQKELNLGSWQVHAVEIPIEDQITINSETVRITGKIDRIDKNTKDNRLRIIDFKTSEETVLIKKMYFAGIWSDLQLPIYARWLKRNNPEHKIEIAYINFSKQIDYNQIDFIEFDQTLATNAEQQLMSLTCDIVNNKFQPANIKKWPEELIYDRTVQNN